MKTKNILAVLVAIFSINCAAAQDINVAASNREISNQTLNGFMAPGVAINPTSTWKGFKRGSIDEGVNQYGQPVLRRGTGFAVKVGTGFNYEEDMNGLTAQHMAEVDVIFERFKVGASVYTSQRSFDKSFYEQQMGFEGKLYIDLIKYRRVEPTSHRKDVNNVYGQSDIRKNRKLSPFRVHAILTLGAESFHNPTNDFRSNSLTWSVGLGLEQTLFHYNSGNAQHPVSLFVQGFYGSSGQGKKWGFNEHNYTRVQAGINLFF